MAVPTLENEERAREKGRCNGTGQVLLKSLDRFCGEPLWIVSEEVLWIVALVRGVLVRGVLVRGVLVRGTLVVALVGGVLIRGGGGAMFRALLFPDGPLRLSRCTVLCRGSVLDATRHVNISVTRLAKAEAVRKAITGGAEAVASGDYGVPR
ncbi:unnamed protein product [Arctogadus glacialis]